MLIVNTVFDLSNTASTQSKSINWSPSTGINKLTRGSPVKTRLPPSSSPAAAASADDTLLPCPHRRGATPTSLDFWMGLEVKELGLRKHWNHLTAWFTIEFYRFVVSLSLDLVAATQISACGGVADLSMWWFACFLLLPQESAAGMSSAWEIRQHDCQVASPADCVL